MSLSAKDRLAAGIIRVVDPGRRKDGTSIGVAPYFGAILRGLIRREITEEQAVIMRVLGMEPTLAVSKDGVLYWWPKFVAGCTPDELAGVLVHEAMHLALKHADRGAAMGVVPEPSIEMHSRARQWNVAGDLCINSDVRKLIALPKDGVFPETFGFPEGLTAEAYYKLLQKKEQKETQKPGGVGSGHCGGCAGHPIPGEPKPSNGTVKDEGRSEAELERMRRAVAEAVKEAAAKNRGNVPSSMVRWADDMLAPPKIPWRTKLARTIRGAVAYRSGCVDYTFSKVSRRQAGVGFGVGRPVIPSTHAPQPNVGCLCDTSGSMRESSLSAAMSEANGVIQAVGGQITFAVIDAALHGIKQVKSAKEAIAMLKGGGGTDMRPGIKALVEHKPQPTVVVVFTDGYIGDPGPEPPFSVVWVIIEGDKTFAPEWGEVIHVDDDESTERAA